MEASESEEKEEVEKSLASLLFSAQSKPRGSALQPFDTAQCAVGPSINTRRLDQFTNCNPHDSEQLDQFRKVPQTVDSRPAAPNSYSS